MEEFICASTSIISYFLGANTVLPFSFLSLIVANSAAPSPGRDG